jgi:hypothetical protein
MRPSNSYVYGFTSASTSKRPLEKRHGINYDSTFVKRLHDAILSKNLAAVRLCFETSNHPYKNRNAGLFKAVSIGSMEIIKYLVDVQKFTICNFNRLIFEKPEAYGQLEILDFLLSRPLIAQPYMLQRFMDMCIECKLEAQMNLCFKHLPSDLIKKAIDQRQRRTDTPFVKHILENYWKKFQIECMNGQRDSYTALSQRVNVTKNSFVDVAKIYIKNKNLPALKNHFEKSTWAYKFNNNLLSEACIVGHKETIDYLLSIGYTTTGINICSAVVALKYHHTDIFKYLLGTCGTIAEENFILCATILDKNPTLMEFLVQDRDAGSMVLMLASKILLAHLPESELANTERNVVNACTAATNSFPTSEKEYLDRWFDTQTDVLIVDISKHKPLVSDNKTVAAVKIWDIDKLSATFAIRPINEILSYSKPILQLIIEKILTFQIVDQPGIILHTNDSHFVRMIKKSFSSFGLLICSSHMIRMIIFEFYLLMVGGEIYGSDGDAQFIMDYFVDVYRPKVSQTPKEVHLLQGSNYYDTPKEACLLKGSSHHETLRGPEIGLPTGIIKFNSSSEPVPSEVIVDDSGNSELQTEPPAKRVSFGVTDSDIEHVNIDPVKMDVDESSAKIQAILDDHENKKVTLQGIFLSHIEKARLNGNRDGISIIVDTYFAGCRNLESQLLDNIRNRK